MKYKFLPSSKVMRFSFIAFIVVILVSFLSIGLLGAALFFIASPALDVLSSNLSNDLDRLSGDWAWPTMIGMPILWSFGFLFAGRVYEKLEEKDWTNLTLKTSYIVILLFWNIIAWFILLTIITAATR